MKKIIVVFALLLAGAVYILHIRPFDRNDINDNNDNDNVPLTYTLKKTNKETKIVSTKTTEIEFKKAKIESSTTPEEREIFPKNNKVDIDALKIKNKINPHWRKLLSTELLRFQKPETKVIIKKNKGLILVSNKEGQYAEEVTISFINQNGLLNAFTALVDSETGKILKTYNRTTWMFPKKNTIPFRGFQK